MSQLYLTVLTLTKGEYEKSYLQAWPGKRVTHCAKCTTRKKFDFSEKLILVTHLIIYSPSVLSNFWKCDLSKKNIIFVIGKIIYILLYFFGTICNEFNWLPRGYKMFLVDTISHPFHENQKNNNLHLINHFGLFSKKKLPHKDTFT